MNTISNDKYAQYFPAVFDWFRKNVNGEEYPCTVLDLRNTERKLVELMHSVTGNVLFRVLIKMTEDPINKDWKPKRNIEDLDELFNTKSDNNTSRITSPQVCFIQVNNQGIPVSAILYTYSPYDEQYHTFQI